MIENGATTIWELWNGNTANPGMNSHNHVMLVGDLNIWFYEYLAGIKADWSEPGFKHIIMRPHPVGDLTAVKASYRSIHGLISSDWEIENGSFEWNVTVPSNTTATVYIPTADDKTITESGQSLAEFEGELLRVENGKAVVSIGSGQYHFRSIIK
jgi:alpha-L-rhamnosidase